uniref:NADH-ubiquinone oxidoreductase chain 4 n=1 Tax=Scomberoides lysan TaxID=334379 RepID=A0A8K1L3B8_9TELE|nr:NADH dehydrogenase subunit 4 [Scomberoides lysan]UDF87775.1 NADH dehydrogenase subunit 4 [Scomberoides lysan]
MLMTLVLTVTIIFTAWLTPAKWLWPATCAHSFIPALISILLLTETPQSGWATVNSFMATDLLSASLLALTCWLLPLMILASQNHTSHEPVARQRTYISLMATLQACLIMAFTATDIILFYISFEATLIPTLMIITRWGNQKERLGAGTSLLFYTLGASLPLLISILVLDMGLNTMSLVQLKDLEELTLQTFGHKIWWWMFLLAFLVKLPLYGVHLWLPKAHVEAPVAGSMILAAVLLKLGGYGMMRIIPLLLPLDDKLSYPCIAIALWGVIMSSTVCLRQTDLKALIAYSSVSHMGLIAGGILINTPWGFTGAQILMIAHGLTSSMLFCLANTNYERTHTRTMVLVRGLQMILPLMTTWWFAATMGNMALPPLPNFMAELTTISTLIEWSKWTIPLLGLGVILTGAYSLYMFIMTQRGQLPKHVILLDPSHSREHLLMALHFLPLLLLVASPELIWGLTA